MKPITNGCIVFDSIYMMGWGRDGWGVTADECVISFGGDNSDLKSDDDGGFTVVYGRASFYCALL